MNQTCAYPQEVYSKKRKIISSKANIQNMLNMLNKPKKTNVAGEERQCFDR